MLNSATGIEEPFYDLFAQSLDIQIYVLKETSDGYEPAGVGNTLTTHPASPPSSPGPILSNGSKDISVLLYRYLDGHYETIGVMDSIGCKTVFSREDDICSWLREIFPESMYKNPQPDLDAVLIQGIATLCLSYGIESINLVYPLTVYEQGDPMIAVINRLGSRINETIRNSMVRRY